MNRLLVLFVVGSMFPSFGVGASGQAPEAAHHAAHAPAVPSTTLTVALGSTEVHFSAADLQAMMQTTVAVQNGHTGQSESYTGPLLSEVLAKAGWTLNSTTEHQVLHSYMLAMGTDGYFTLYSGAEVQAALHRSQVVVALMENGKPLAEKGAFQLVDTLDTKPARWVRNLERLAVVTVSTPAH